MGEIISKLLYEPLYNALMFLVWFIPGHNVGVAIILLTLVVRLILLPSTNKSMKAQKHMRELQPKMEAIKQKHKDNKEEQTKAMMELYREHKVNPLGSCLPLLIQLPIIFVLYRVLQVGLDKSHFDLLYSFVPRADSINTFLFGINLAQPEKWILPILTGVLQYVQTWQMQGLMGAPTKQSGNDKQADMMLQMNKQMMYLMPIMMVFIARSLPAALSLYLIVTTLFAIVQQWWFFKKYPVKTVAVGERDEHNGKNEKARKAVSAKPKLNPFKKNDVVVTVRRKNG